MTLAIVCIAVVVMASANPCAAAQPIPDAALAELRQDFAATQAEPPTSVARRRGLKNIVRQGQALLDASPDAPNRFVLLELMFQSQKRLIAMDNSARNRATLFEIVGALAKAPDAFADLRLEADLMLSEMQLSQRNATLEQRAAALEQLIARYRDTPGEAKSLLMGALIVQKLDAPKLEDAIYYALDERFSDDHEVIAFRRNFLKITRLDVTFTGEFKRADGTVVNFPTDTAGHQCLMVFWSKEKPGWEAFLKKQAAGLAPLAGLLDVFSFNVDGLPDGGASILREHGLNWTAMQLPGGRRHQAYQTYAQADPMCVLVNEYGYSVVRPEILHGRLAAVDPMRLSELRYSVQLQSLFIGDFLLNDSPGHSEATGDALAAIKACIPQAPMRYRVRRDQMLANYRKAAAKAAEAIKATPDSADSARAWRVRNHRIIALLGVWNLALDPDALDQAVAEAKAALASGPPVGGDVVPRFCLAKAAMRDDRDRAEEVVTEFLKACGGDAAPASALAAATVLALHAQSRPLHETYRQRFLEQHSDDARYFALSAYLRDRHHRFRVLAPNYVRRERGTRPHIVAHGGEPMTEPFPPIELKHIDGSALRLPGESSDKLTLLLFIEPPTDPDADFPVSLDRQGKPTRQDHVRRVMDYAQDLVDSHVNKGVRAIAVIVDEDAERARALMERNGWTGEVAVVPGGLDSEVVRRLGILSADRLPNVFLLRRDGTIAWTGSGLTYKAEFGFPFAYLLAMKVHIEASEVAFACKALEAGRYDEAAKVFAGPFLPKNPDRFGWRPPRYHGLALAHAGRKDWAAALEAIDQAIDAQKLGYFRGRRRKAEAWREDAATVEVGQPDDVMTELWTTKALILDKLGRVEQAAAVRELAAQPARASYQSIYWKTHDRLKTIRVHNVFK